MNVERSASAAAVDADSPWPGLASFTEDQGAFFYGRDEEIRELARLAERRPLTVLFGQSGLGKSSLLQAGVFPRLRTAGFCPIYIRLDHGEGAPSPTEQIKTMVHAVTAQVGTWTKPGSARAGETLWEFFHHRDDRLIPSGSGRGVPPMSDHPTQSHGRDARATTLIPVLVFDQFEELFTLGQARGARRDRALAFIAELAELVENRPSEQLVARLEDSSAEMDAFDFGRTDYRVVISLREDFLPDLESLKTIMPALMESRMRLTRLTGTQALEAVLKPGGNLVTEEVARAIVEFVAGARGGSTERLAELHVDPSLLSVVCRELNERRRMNGARQITADQVSGDRREILNDFYERSVADLPEAMRLFVEDRLLTKSGFRDNLALENALESPGVTRPLIDTLVSRRLLQLEDRLGQQRVELSHDVLAEVIRASRDARQQRLEVERLREHEQRVVAEAARRSRRQRWMIAALAVVVAALVLAGVFGLRRERLAARQASATDLILASRALQDGNVSNGLAYLVRAARRDPKNTILGPRILTTLVSHNFLQSEGTALALPSPATGRISATTTLSAPRLLGDGRTAVFLGEDRILRAIDIETWRLVKEYDFGKGVHFFTVGGENDSVLAVLLTDRSIVVCDAASGALRAPLIKPWATLTSVPPATAYMSLSSDGRWLAVNASPNVWIYDAQSGEQRHASQSASGFLRFNPDSRSFIAQPLENSAVIQTWSLPDFVARPNFNLIATVVRSPVFAPDGKTLVVWHPQGRIQSYDVATGLARGRPITPQPGTFSDWFITPDNKRLVFAGDHEVTVADLETGELSFPRLSHDGQVYTPTMSKDGNVLMTTCSDGYVRVWDLRTGRPLAEPTLQQSRWAPAVLSPDGTKVVIFSNAGPVYRRFVGRGAAAPLILPHRIGGVATIWRAGAPSSILRPLSDRALAIDVVTGKETEGGFAYPTVLASPNSTLFHLAPGGLMAIVGGVPGTSSDQWHLWRRDPGGAAMRDLGTLEGGAPVGNAVLLEPTQEFVRAVTNSSVQVWSTRTGKRVASIPFQGTIVTGGAVFSPKMPYLSVVTNTGAGYVTAIWSIPDGRQVASLASDAGSVGPVSFGSDGTRFKDTPGGTTIRLIDVASGKVLQVFGKLEGEAFAARAESSDGTRLVTWNAGAGLQFWDTTTGKPVGSAPGQRVASIFGPSPDGYHVLSGATDGISQLWDMRTAEPVGAPMPHPRRLSSAAFNPKGDRILTGTSAFEIRLWDAATGLPLNEPTRRDELAGPVVGFSPDGRFYLTGNGTSIPYHVWSVPPDGGNAPVPAWLLRLATLCAGRQLTDQGEFVPVFDDSGAMDAIRRELLALPADAPFAEWGRWFVASSATRSIAPGFKITPAEAEELAAVLADPDPMQAFVAQDDVLVSQGDWEGAVALERRALDRTRALRTFDNQNLDQWLLRLSATLLELAGFAEAEPLAREALDLHRRSGVPDPNHLAAIQGVLGAALVGQGRDEEAGPLLTAAFDAVDAAVNANGWTAQRRAEWRRAATFLSQFYDDIGQTEAAMALTLRIRALGARGTE